MEQPPASSTLDVSLVDAYGELVFGRRLRLHVLLWVAEHDDVFNQSQAAAGVGYSSSGEVGKELERLVALDMVRKFGRPSRVGPQNYARIADHPGWLIAEAVRTALTAIGAGAGAGAPDAGSSTGGAHGEPRAQRSSDGDAHHDRYGDADGAAAGDPEDISRVPSIQRHRRRPS
jgi:hypothetical protein